MQTCPVENPAWAPRGEEFRRMDGAMAQERKSAEVYTVWCLRDHREPAEPVQMQFRLRHQVVKPKWVGDVHDEYVFIEDRETDGSLFDTPRNLRDDDLMGTWGWTKEELIDKLSTKIERSIENLNKTIDRRRELMAHYQSLKH